METLPVEEVKQMFASMNVLYIVVTLLFLGAAVLFWFTSMPENKSDDTLSNDGGALKYPQLVLGMIAIFTYVGVEVSVQSNLGELLKKGSLGMYNGVTIATFVSMYWGGLMVGRWTSGASVFKKSKGYAINIIAAILAYAVVCLANYGILNITGKWAEFDPIHFAYFAPFVLAFILLYLVGKDRPATTLLYLGVFGMLAMVSGMLLSGTIAVYSLLVGGLACSIMWPFIFSLAVSGLGKHTSQGSSYLIMMIIGGGVIPVLQGILGDATGNMQLSYLIPVLCFAYLAYFAYRVKAVLKEQGIEADSIESEGGH
jgi:MFS transporter, FHS family, L-fucose permease